MVAIVAVNRLRGRRPLQRPDRVGTPELAVFVFAPALLPALFSKDHLTDSLGAVVLNLVILAVAFVVTSYGLVPMTRWALGQMFRQLANVTDLMVRSLPLLLLFATFLFLTTEIWQVAADLEAPFFLMVLGMLFAAGTLFLVLRQRREVDEVARFAHLGRRPGVRGGVAGRGGGRRPIWSTRRSPSPSVAGPGSTSRWCWSSARACRSSSWRR